ncbi:MAG TPA: PP2C family protein-serine/threonine phosphatase [Vicinamibacterales bacterium]
MPVTLLELLGLVIGSLFVAIGAVAGAGAWSAYPRVNRSAAWFGVFCVLYGVRMLAGSELLQAATGWPPALLLAVRADITYTILVPATLFIESIVGPGRYALLRRTWQALAIAGGVAILIDLLTRPRTAIDINPPLVVLSFVSWLWHLRAATRATTGPWSHEVRAVVAAGAVLAVAALFETIFGAGRLGEVVIEPLAMLLFASALGWYVLTRARQQELSYAALSRELDLARTIQQSLLPQSMPDVRGLRVAGAYVPMSAVAGDFYDVIQLPGGRALVLVADVSGHGVPAALIASMVKVAVAAEADRHERPGDILTGINRALTGKFDRAYVTACCVIADVKRHAVLYAAAGHPPPLMRRSDGRIEPLDQGGVVLTLMPSITYATHEVPFAPGDRLVMYTDGLTEAARADGDEFFGDAELARVVSSTPLTEDLLRTVQEGHRRWIGDGTPVGDDISIVVIEHVADHAMAGG